MKKNRIIGVAVACLGVAMSMGTAAALYTKAATDTGFGIGAGTYSGSTGTVTYKINNETSGSVAPTYISHAGDHVGTGLSLGATDETTFDQVHYEFTLSATYAAELSAQDYVTGNLAVSLTNVPEAWRGKVSVWAGVTGYVENSLGAHYYSEFTDGDYAITAEHQTLEMNKDIAVASSGVQKLSIYVKYNLAGIDNLEQNEATLGYTLSVTWGAASAGFGRAYVVGVGNAWTQDDEFVMAPNINKANAEGWEWIYNNLPGTIGLAKCNKGTGEGAVWSSGENFEPNAAKSYTVYWNGEGSGAASFAEIVPNP